LFLLDPPPTSYDLHFQVAGIPVRVHPFFWLTAVLLGHLDRHPATLVMWVGVVFISILVHELGHALTMRRFGEMPRIVLYAMGGFATADRQSAYGFQSFRPYEPAHKRREGPWRRVLILAAGPGAGFLLAALTLLGIRLTGGDVRFHASFPTFWSFSLAVGTIQTHRALYELLHMVLTANVLWGLMNLVPVQPLDGGQIAREIFVWRNPWRGLVFSLWLSVAAGIAMVALALKYHDLFLGILFGMLAYGSFTALQRIEGRGRGW